MNESRNRPNNGEYREYHPSTSTSKAVRTDNRKWQNSSLTRNNDSFDRSGGRNLTRNRTYQRSNHFDTTTTLQSEESVSGVHAGQDSDWPQPRKGWSRNTPGPEVGNPVQSKNETSDSNKEGNPGAKFIVKKREEVSSTNSSSGGHRSKEASPSVQPTVQEPSAGVSESADWPSLQQPQRASRPTRGTVVAAPVVTIAAAATAPVVASSPTRLTHLQEVPLPPQPLTLVTPGGRFIDEAQRQEILDYLEPSNTNFTVVGVLGLQSSGKSSLLNALLLNRPPGDQEDLQMPSDRREFPVENLESLLENAHRTRGVQLQTTPERLFLLDCEALLALPSAETLIQAAASERRGGGAGGAAQQSDFITVETGATMQGIQLSAFLMSACHLLLVLSDGWPDPDMLRLLLAADMLRPAVLDDTSFQPRLVFVLNRTGPGNGPAPGRLCDLLAGVFEGAAFRFNSSSVFCLPLLDEATQEAAVEYTEELERLRKLILTSPRHHMLRQDLFNEKVWLDFAAEVWENIEKSVMLAEYHRLIG